MKKYLLVIATGMLALFTACNNEKKTDDAKTPEVKTDATVQKNLETVHAINKSFETGDFSSMRKYLADDAVDHAGEKGDVKGADNIVTALTDFGKMVTDMKSIVKKEFADNEYAIQWLTLSGKMLVPAYGFKAGETYSMDAVEVTRFNSDGKCAEHWEYMQMGDILKMMGGAQQNK